MTGYRSGWDRLFRHAWFLLAFAAVTIAVFTDGNRQVAAVILSGVFVCTGSLHRHVDLVAKEILDD